MVLQKNIQLFACHSFYIISLAFLYIILYGMQLNRFQVRWYAFSFYNPTKILYIKKMSFFLNILNRNCYTKIEFHPISPCTTKKENALLSKPYNPQYLTNI